MTNMIMGTAGGGISCCVLDVWHTDPGKVPVREIPGYVYYRIFALFILLFEIVAFPMKYLCCSLKQLTVIWGLPADPSLFLCNMEKDGEFWQTVSGQYRAVRKRIYPCLFCCWQQ